MEKEKENHDCPFCNGRGVRFENISGLSTVCRSCRGTGKQVAREDKAETGEHVKVRGGDGRSAELGNGPG